MMLILYICGYIFVESANQFNYFAFVSSEKYWFPDDNNYVTSNDNDNHNDDNSDENENDVELMMELTLILWW